MFTCYHCAKGIDGNIVHTHYVGDFPKAFHPDCYHAAERDAAAQLAAANYARLEDMHNAETRARNGGDGTFISR